MRKNTARKPRYLTEARSLLRETLSDPAAMEALFAYDPRRDLFPLLQPLYDDHLLVLGALCLEDPHAVPGELPERSMPAWATRALKESSNSLPVRKVVARVQEFLHAFWDFDVSIRELGRLHEEHLNRSADPQDMGRVRAFYAEAEMVLPPYFGKGSDPDGTRDRIRRLSEYMDAEFLAPDDMLVLFALLPGADARERFSLVASRLRSLAISYHRAAVAF